MSASRGSDAGGRRGKARHTRRGAARRADRPSSGAGSPVIVSVLLLAAAVPAVAVLWGCGSPPLSAVEARNRRTERLAGQPARQVSIQGQVTCGRQDGTFPGAKADCLVIEDLRSERRYLVRNAGTLDPALFAARRKSADTFAAATGTVIEDSGAVVVIDATALRRLDAGARSGNPVVVAKADPRKTAKPADPAETQPKPDPSAGKTVKLDPVQPKIDPTPKTGPKVGPKTDTPPATDPKVDPKSAPKADPTPKVEPKTDPTPKTDPVAKVEPKTTPKVEPKVAVKADPPDPDDPVPSADGKVVIEGTAVCARDDRGATDTAMLAVISEPRRKLYLVPEAEARYPALFAERFQKNNRRIRVIGVPETVGGRKYLRDVSIEVFVRPGDPAIPGADPKGTPKADPKTEPKTDAAAKTSAEAGTKPGADPAGKAGPAFAFITAEGDLVCTRCSLGVTRDCRCAVKQGPRIWTLTGEVPDHIRRASHEVGRHASVVGRAEVVPDTVRLVDVQVVDVKLLAN